MKWISIKDKLPGHGYTNLVLLFALKQNPIVGFYSEYDKKFYDENYTGYIENVTHWMSLPSKLPEGICSKCRGQGSYYNENLHKPFYTCVDCGGTGLKNKDLK
jgi:Protein of unknown function (DUF551)